jgi:hypothetical protein
MSEPGAAAPPAKLSWPQADGAVAYHLKIFDERADRVLADSGPLHVPEYELPPFAADTGTSLALRLEVLNGVGEWKLAGPLARLRLTPGLELSWEGRSPLHRVLVLDATAGRAAIDEVVVGSSAVLDPEAIDWSHDLRYLVYARVGEGWEEIQDWRPLPLPLLLGPRHDRPPALDPSAPPRLLLVFTIDTECGVHRMRHPDPARAVDELIFGDFGDGRRLGIELHMDLLEHFGARGCFFVDVLMEYQFGQAALERVIEAIMSRGHEVQLHVHSEHLAFARDERLPRLAGSLPSGEVDRFREVMELSVDLFERRVGRRPLAFRSGGYYINDGYLEVVREHGIRIDSSIYSYFHSQVSDWMRVRTQPFRVGELLELPPSWFLRTDAERPDTRQYAPNQFAGDPFTTMIRPRNGAAPLLATYVSHSFQLISLRQENEEFNAEWEHELRGHVPPEVAELLVPEPGHRFAVHDPHVDEFMVAAVVSLLRRVAEAPDARCVTYAELDRAADGWWREPRRDPVDPVPTFDPRDGRVSQFGTRVYSRGLLAAMPPSPRTSEQPAPEQLTLAADPALTWRGADVAIIGACGPDSGWLAAQTPFRVQRVAAVTDLATGKLDIAIWTVLLEERSPAELLRALRRLRGTLRLGGQALLHMRTLGVRSEASLPPLAELLFAQRELTAVFGSVPVAITAWDGATLIAALRAQGLDLVAEHRHDRSPAELTAIGQHPGKLRVLDSQELRTGSIELIVHRPYIAPVAARTAWADETELQSRNVEHFQRAAERLHESLAPGAQTELRLATERDGILSPTTMVLALQRAGLEVLEHRAAPGATLVRCCRPLDLRDILLYAGQMPD